jgi:putative transposase
VGEGGDAVAVAGFIRSQRTEHGVPPAVTCRALQVSESRYDRWRDRQPSQAQARRAGLDQAIRQIFDASGGTYGSPRVTLELQAAGWRVGENSVARRMAALGLAGRAPKRRRNLTRQGNRPAAPDRVHSQFSAPAPDVVWCGDMTEIVTGEGKLYPATVIDLFCRRLLGSAMSAQHDAELVEASLNMAATTRGAPWTA